VPSVAITALTPPTVMINPLTNPARAPAITPTTMLSAVEPVVATTLAMQNRRHANHRADGNVEAAGNDHDGLRRRQYA